MKKIIFLSLFCIIPLIASACDDSNQTYTIRLKLGGRHNEHFSFSRPEKMKEMRDDFNKIFEEVYKKSDQLRCYQINENDILIIAYIKKGFLFKATYLNNQEGYFLIDISNIFFGYLIDTIWLERIKAVETFFTQNSNFAYNEKEKELFTDIVRENYEAMDRTMYPKTKTLDKHLFTDPRFDITVFSKKVDINKMCLFIQIVDNRLFKRDTACSFKEAENNKKLLFTLPIDKTEKNVELNEKHSKDILELKEQISKLEQENKNIKDSVSKRSKLIIVLEFFVILYLLNLLIKNKTSVLL